LVRTDCDNDDSNDHHHPYPQWRGAAARRSPRTALSTAAWAALVVIAVAAGASTFFLVQSSGVLSPHGSGYSVSSAATTTRADSPGGAGLQLSLALNVTNISSGHAIAATAEELNTGTAALNISSSSQWPIDGLAVGPCGTVNYPVGLAVLQGVYGLSNFTSGTPLQIYKPGTYGCPAILSGIKGFMYQAASANATVVGGCQPGDCMNEIVTPSISVSGYWNGGSFTSFPSGIYTVVAGDEWGGVSILHFAVR
jgi:hypothetical protein